MFKTWVSMFDKRIFYTLAVLSVTAAALLFAAKFNTADAQVKGDGGDKTVNAAPSATFNGTGFGNIPDRGVAGCSDTNPATSLSVTFNVTGLSGAPSKVELNNLVFGPQVHTWVGDLKAVLIAPSGQSHNLFGRTGATTSTACGSASDAAGPYNFADDHAAPPSGGWWQASIASPIPTGDYRTTALGGAGATNPAPATSMNPAFTGATANGTWTLRFTDHGAGDTGAVSSANLLVETAAAVPFDTNMDMNGDGKTDYVVVRDTGSPLSEGETVGEGPVNKGVYTIRERMAKDREDALNGTNTDNVGSGQIAWYTSINGPGTFSAVTFGQASTDFVVPNDYDGDGKTDHAVWRPGAPFTAAFYILQSSTNTVRTDIFGQTGDDPAITGDYDGDGKADTATFRCPALGAGDGQCYFYYRPSNPVITPAGIWVVPWGFGETFDFFVNPGDYDGDGKHDFCLQRTNPGFAGRGQFVLLKSNGFGVEYINWGFNTDIIVPGDYDGDGRSDFMVSRTETLAGNPGRSYYLLERDGGGTGEASPIRFGIAGDVRAPGDYDGDGKQDVAVWRPDANPALNFFYVLRSSDGGLTAFEWGQQGDFPAASWYVH